MLITKKLNINADSGALYSYLGLKVTWSLHYGAGQIFYIIIVSWFLALCYYTVLNDFNG